jgi:AcrR family transcriptional regulator
MAYEVTKKIKGRDYRYLVETRLDPQTKRRKAKWTYVGPVVGDGVREVVAHRSNHVTKDDIVAAAAKLLEARDPEYVTVTVIAAAASASRSTFYRYFENREAALKAALVRLTDNAIRDHPTLDQDVRTVEAARATFRAWCAAHYHSIGSLRAIRKMISEGYHGKVNIAYVRSLLKRDPWAELEAFLRAIGAAGVAQIPDPSALSQAVLGTMIAVKYVPYLTPRSETLNLPAFEDLYPMFERAIFLRSVT